MLDQDKLDTAALIALEVQDEPHRLRAFKQRWAKEFGIENGLECLLAARPYYEAYFGFDGYTSPTHDMNTGKRLHKGYR